MFTRETVLPQMNNGMHLIINILNQIIVTRFMA